MRRPTSVSATRVFHGPVKVIAATALAAFAVLAAGGNAGATVTSVSVVSVKDIGSFNHRPYHEVKLRMLGLAPGGAYDVPVTLAYPTHARDSSGVTIVEPVND